MSLWIAFTALVVFWGLVAWWSFAEQKSKKK